GGGSDGGTGGGSDGGTGDGSDGGTGGGSDGDSDGEGECDPATDPDKCGQSSVGGEACDVQIECNGDAVQCAILKQQKEMRCNAEEQADFENKKTDIEGLFQGEEFQLEEAEVDAPSFINSAGRFLPSGCPTAEVLNMRSGGGGSLQLSYEPLCEAASGMSWLIVAFTAMFCAVYVGRAFGGA
ncbi:virulence factor TspB C-terminal domain-related protein, partial [Stutzerimonas stutzeri]|uniref:virulence factor TspB C-terminal domain-related protein n=1 Tax=Stutzerimonas stutzeri TaxID=316 RepID=UPI0023514969